MNGKVKFFNKNKGFGFIAGEDGTDYFVHITAIPEGLFLREEDAVTFDAVDTDKGMQAQNVQKADGAAPAEEAQEEAPEEGSEEEAPAEEASEEEAPAEEAPEEEAPAEEAPEEEAQEEKEQ